MKSLVFSAIVLTGIVLFAPLAIAVERNVPSEYATIQAAINASSNGDVVIIAPGTYTGTGNKDLDFAGKAITVRSTEPHNYATVATTIIDCVYAGRGFYFHSGENSNSVVSGLTILRGNIGYAPYKGGGIYCSGSSPTIENCIILGCEVSTGLYPNDTPVYGGGIYADSGIIKNCTIMNNSITGGEGSPEMIMPPVSPGNGANVYGGGVYGESVQLINCLVANNWAWGGNGGFASFYNSYGGSVYGAGVMCNQAIVRNCSIVGNTAVPGQGSGISGINGTIYGDGLNGTSLTEVSNCIIWGNGLNIYGNPTITYSDVGGGWAGTGNINTDPRFVSGPEGNYDEENYYLSQVAAGQATNSPCINAGSNTAANLEMNSKTTRTDIVVDTGIVDMGYHYPIPVLDSDLNGDAFVDFIDYAVLANVWLQSPDPCNPNSSDIVQDGQVNIYDLAELCVDWLNCFVTRATGPVPAHNAINVSINVILQWASGNKSASYDIYFGTDYNQVNNADITDPCVYRGNRDVNFWDTNNYAPVGLIPDANYYWRIDEIAGCMVKGNVWRFTTIPLPPGQASNPVPANGVVDIGITTDISWTAGNFATSHDVYFGTVNPPPFRGNQTGTTYDTGTMDTNTTYYWQINERNTSNATTGDIWSFKTIVQLPGQAGNPTPADSATNIGIVTDLSWTAGSLATSHNVYFGTTNPPPFRGNQTGTTYDTGTMDINTTYYWQVDEKNASGITTGILWSFTTSAFDLTLVGLWKFDEGTGTIAYDLTGINNGQLINGPIWTTGKIGGGLGFDGNNDYVEVNDNPTLRFSQYNNFSIVLWVNPAVSTSGELVSKMRTGGIKDVFGYEVQYDGPNKRFTFVIEQSYRRVWVVSTPINSASPGQWYHVACVYDNTNMKIYRNGTPSGPTTFTGGTGNSTPDKNLAIGARSCDSTVDYYFNGIIDGVRIYNRALTASEITQLKQGQ